MADLARPPAKHTVRKGVPFGDCHRCQRHPVRDVTNSVNRRYRCLRIRIDRYFALRTERHASGFKTQSRGVRQAPGRRHHLIDIDDNAVTQRYGFHILRSGNDTGDCAIGMENDSAACQCRRRLGPNFFVKSAKWQLRPVDKMGFDTEAIKNAREFARYVPRAIDNDPIGSLSQIKRLVRGNGVFRKARHLGYLRPATGGDQKPFRRDLSLADTNAVRPADDAAPLDQFNPGIGQQRSVDGFKAVQFAVLGVDQRRPVMTIHTQLPAITGGIFDFGRK